MTRITTAFDAAVKDLDRVRTILGPALDMIADPKAGIAAQSYDRSRSGGIPDPTGEAATADVLDIAHLHATRDHQAIVDHVRTLAHIADQLVAIVGRWQRPNASQLAIASRQADAANRAKDGCEPCRGIGTWSPIHVKTPVPLCRWCYDWQRKVGRVPKPDELRKHHRGEKVKLPFTGRAVSGLQAGSLGVEVM